MCFSDRYISLAISAPCIVLLLLNSSLKKRFIMAKLFASLRGKTPMSRSELRDLRKYKQKLHVEGSKICPKCNGVRSVPPYAEHGKQRKCTNCKGTGYVPKNSKGCFVTTAVMSHLNSPDDCYELQVLRSFRDDYLLKSVNGENLVESYYDKSPRLLDIINNTEAENIHEYLYVNYIKIIIKYIENHSYQDATKKYIEMVNYIESMNI